MLLWVPKAKLRPLSVMSCRRILPPFILCHVENQKWSFPKWNVSGKWRRRNRMGLALWRSSRQSLGTCFVLFIGSELSSHIPVEQPPKELAFPTALTPSTALSSCLLFLGRLFLTEVPDFTSVVCLAGQQWETCAAGKYYRGFEVFQGKLIHISIKSNALHALSRQRRD